VAIGADGKRKLSRRVANDETALLELSAVAVGFSDSVQVTWAIDRNVGGAALLTDNGQQVLYIPGRTVHHTSGSYRGDGKSDAKDGFVIADQARMRRDLEPMHRGDDIAVDLRILTSRRLDLAADRTRRIGKNRLATWLKSRKVRNPQLVAGTDTLIEGRFRHHHHAEVVLSMPSICPVLGAEFIAHTGGNLSIFASADRLAGVGGLGKGHITAPQSPVPLS
jgi:hypothetical protein